MLMFLFNQEAKENYTAYQNPQARLITGLGQQFLPASSCGHLAD
jgi:hypothetical protein